MEQGLHNFGEQEQGQEHKVLLDAVLIDSNSSKKAMVSLYRPATKKGDPRIWFSGLKSFVAPNEILALIALDGKVYVLNLTKIARIVDLLRTTEVIQSASENLRLRSRLGMVSLLQSSWAYSGILLHGDLSVQNLQLIQPWGAL